jgi:S-adenosylmethionine/arginine decarboxylase-like enzyme
MVNILDKNKLKNWHSDQYQLIVLNVSIYIIWDIDNSVKKTNNNLQKILLNTCKKIIMGNIAINIHIP